MPFGICSAPEVFQRYMHQMTEGLQVVEVVADDFVTVGFGETLEGATLNHDQNLRAFLHIIICNISTELSKGFL